MPKITAETATGTVEFEMEAGRKLVLGLEDNGVDILHRCGGNAKCTTCHVAVTAGDAGAMSDAETAVLAGRPEMSDGDRLSCQIHVQSDLSVKVSKQASVLGMDAGTRPAE